MACEIGTNVIVCGPPRLPVWRHIGDCPLCQRRRRLVTQFDGTHYGTTTYCVACNGREQDGEWRPAPDSQYAAQSRAYVAALWRDGVSGDEFRRRVAEHQRNYWNEEA